MGKKSKQRRSASLNQQAGLDDAFKALQEAQSSIDALRRAQERASEEVRQASADVQRAKECSATPYGDERYWESRYQKDVSTSPPTGNSELYEWYLPYSDLRRMLGPEIDRYGVRSARVLVPGCGNSSLCEDLANDGLQLLKIQKI